MLFPLCDSRGLISGCLTGKQQRAEDQQAENVFFAWLLDLPAEIDAAAAARAMFLVSGIAVDDSGASAPKQELEEKFQRTLVGLLQRVITRDTLYDLPEKSALVDEIQKGMPPN